MMKRTRMGWKVTLGHRVLGYYPTETEAQAALERANGGRSRAELKEEFFSEEEEE